MKTSHRLLAVVATAAFTFGFAAVHAQDAPPPPPPPDQGAPDAGAPPPPDQGGDDQGASFQEFYDQLGDQGNWIQTDDYGYVFQPNVSDPNWAPYSDGHWVYSDAGWVWVSDEPWGWATYHYGRWANIDGTGWVWVPGYEWAPAWVSWRYGGGYCGWAPLPPGTFVGAEYASPGVAIGIGFHFGGDVDVSFNIGPGCYNFVPVNCMGYPNYHDYYLDRSRNFVVINNTTNITNININRHGGSAFRNVVVNGPPINEINAHVATHIPTVRLASSYQPGRAALNGNTLSVFAPHVNPATLHQARPARVAQTIAKPTFNRGDSISQPMQVNSTLRPQAPTEAQILAAKTAAEHASPKAKIATEKTVARTSINRPLTSMQAVSSTRAPTGNVNGAKQTTTGERGSPYTGEAATHNAANSEVHAKSSPYTGGEAATEHKTAQHTAESPYTGGGASTERKNVEPSSTGERGSPYGGESNRSSSSPQERSVQHESAQPQERAVQHSNGPAGGGPGAGPRPQVEPKGGPQGGGGNGNKNDNGQNGGPGGR